MSSWPDIALGDVATLVRGISYNTPDLADVGEGRPFITLKCFEKGGGFRLDGLKGFRSRADASYVVKPGDLLIANTDLTREASVVGVPAIVPQELYGSRPVISMDVSLVRVENTKADTRFIAHALALPRSRTFMKDNSAGSTVLHLKVGQVPRLQIPFPPRGVQARIAEVLDTADEAIWSAQRLIAKLEHAKDGLLHDLLTRGIHETGRLRHPKLDADQFSEGPLGLLPRSWRICDIGSMCSLVADCPHTTPIFRDEGTLVARTTNIRDGRFILEGASYVDEQEYRERILRAEPQSGDLIFTREAPVGEAFVVPPWMRICLGQRVMLLRPAPKILDSVYMLSQIYSGFVSARISVLTAGTTNPHLNVSEVRKFLIPVPPIGEQQSIARIVSEFDAEINLRTDELRKFRLLRQGLMDDLLTGRVRVGASV